MKTTIYIVYLLIKPAAMPMCVHTVQFVCVCVVSSKTEKDKIEFHIIKQFYLNFQPENGKPQFRFLCVPVEFFFQHR